MSRRRGVIMEAIAGIDIAIWDVKAKALGVPQRTHTEQEILERCLYPLLNEGFRILEEGVAIRASDIDVVYCHGFGFPRYRGGPMFYAHTVGLAAVLDQVRAYRARFGDYWNPSPLLERLVAEGTPLFGDE